MLQAKTASLKSNFIYNTAYQILAIVIPLFTTPYLSRILGAEQIGVFSFSNSVAYYFAMFAMLGVTNYGNRSIAMVRDNKKELSKTFLEIYSFQLATSLIILLVYVLYVVIIAKDKNISLIFVMYVASSVFDINWFYCGLERFKSTTARNTFVKLFTVVLIFIFVKTEQDVNIYAAIYSSGILISQIVMWISAKKYVLFEKVSMRGVASHIKPNLVLFIPVIAISLYKFMDKIMLGIMTTKYEVGLYESADRMILVPSVLINSLGTVMLPRISNLVANKKNKEGMAYLSKSIRFESFLASSLSFGIMGVANLFVPLYYGPGFEKCISLFYILLPSCLFVGFANVIRTQYMIPNKMDVAYTVSVLAGTIINLVLNMALIPLYGSVGAAIATLIAEFLVCLIHCLYVKRYLPIIHYIAISLPSVLSGTFMFVLLMVIDFSFAGGLLIQLLLKTLFGGLIYLLVFSLLSSKDIRTILVKRRKL